MINAIKRISSAIDKNSYDEIISFLSNPAIKWNRKNREILEKPIRFFQSTKINEILACIILYTHFAGDDGLIFARQRGLFAYYLNWHGTERILYWLISNKTLLNVSKETEIYLNHKYEIRWLAEYYKNCDQKIDSIIEEHKKKKRCFQLNGVTLESNIVMELLTILELLFRLSKGQRESNKAAALELYKVLNYDVPDYYSLEELGEAVSYIISRYYELHQNSSSPIWIDIDTIKNSIELEDLIHIAAKRKLVSEWEVDIDYYGYDIENVDGSTLYRIIDKHNIEKSKQLGFIKTEFQEQARNIWNYKSLENCANIYDLADEIRKHPDFVFELVNKDTDVERYRMIFYTPLLQYFMPKDYNKPEFFAEEIVQIEDAVHEMFLPTDELLRYKITDICTVKDVILFKRFFTFVSYAQQVFIEEHNGELETIAKSIVPTFRKENLITLLEQFVGGKRKAENLINLYCWDGNGFLDIQATPIIKVNKDQYLLVPFVLAVSNLIRNVIVKERKNDSQETNSNGASEPLEIYAKKIFDYQNEIFSHKEGRKLKYNGKAGEVDLVVWSERHLYLIECKNSILPTSHFELRTTYDYIKKAEDQLDLSSSALIDSASRKQILNNWGVPIRDYEIHTLILLGNRIFTAPNGFKHQVRYIHELYMILTGGEINSSFGKWRYWQKETFSEEDFIRFISEKDPLNNDFLEALCPVKLVISCEEYKIERESYSLNIVKHWEMDDKNLVNLSTEEQMKTRVDYEKKHEETIKEIRKNTAFKWQKPS